MVAEAMLAVWATVDMHHGNSRTGAAYRQALTDLGWSHASNDPQCLKGREAADAALKWAFRQLIREAPRSR
jgi:hypothetical protein